MLDPVGGAKLDAAVVGCSSCDTEEATASVHACLARCRSLQTANEALLAALASAAGSVVNCKYTIKWDAAALMFTAYETAVREPAAAIVANWAPPPGTGSDGLLTAPTDVFNDRLSYAVRGLHDVERLNNAMAPVAAKFAFFAAPGGDPPLALEACRTFVSNYATLHDQLARLWARVEGEPSRLPAIRTRLAELNGGDVLSVAQALGLAAPLAAGGGGGDGGSADDTAEAPGTVAAALAAMEAVKARNSDVIAHIRGQTRVSQYTYALLWDAPKGALGATAAVTSSPVASVLATWRLPREPWLTAVHDIFNDKLPLPPTGLPDVFALNDAMAGVARKYCAFGETPLAQATCAAMLSNYKLVEAELGRLADSLADATDARTRVAATLARVNAGLAALMATTGARPGGCSEPEEAAASTGGCDAAAAAAAGGAGTTVAIATRRPVPSVAATATTPRATPPMVPVQPLVAAALAGDVAAVAALLRDGIDPDGADGRTGTTPLHAAADGGHAAVTRLLLAAGARVDPLDADGCTPLLVAAARRHKEVVAELVRRGANVSATDADGKTPLHRAATNNAGDVVTVLLEAGAAVAAVDAAWATPLHYAARHGDGSLVRALLKAGANKEATTRQGERPVHWAASNASGSGALDALLAAGANAAALDAVGGGLLHHAAAGGTADTVRRVLALPAADASACDTTDASPLHWAARTGSLDAVATLVAAEAPLEALDKEGMTPLLAAACRGHVAVVDALRGAGARGGIDELDGKHPLAIAAGKGDVAAVERLAGAGAPLDAGHPLATAAKAGHADVVRVLLAAAR